MFGESYIDSSPAVVDCPPYEQQINFFQKSSGNTKVSSSDTENAWLYCHELVGCGHL